MKLYHFQKYPFVLFFILTDTNHLWEFVPGICDIGVLTVYFLSRCLFFMFFVTWTSKNDCSHLLRNVNYNISRTHYYRFLHSIRPKYSSQFLVSHTKRIFGKSQNMKNFFFWTRRKSFFSAKNSLKITRWMSNFIFWRKR